MAHRGDGMLYQRGRIWWLKFYQDGDVVRMSSGSEDERVARKLLRDQTARVQLHEPLVVRSARVTYAELRDDLIAHYTATGARDLEEAGWRIAHLDRAFRGVRAAQLTSPAITRYIVDRQAAGAANGTINREVAVLLRMLRLGLEHHKVARLPIVHKPKEAAPRAGFFEAEAFQAVRARLPEDLQVAVTLAHTYGWRMQSEVLTLALRQLDLGEGALRLDVGSTKNDDGRVVYLTPELTTLLTAHVGRVQALSREIHALPAPLRAQGPDRHAARRFPEGLGDGLPSGRLSGDAAARLPADGRAEHGAGRGAALGRHEDHRAPHRVHVPPVRDREPGRPQAGDGADRGRFGHSLGHRRAGEADHPEAEARCGAGLGRRISVLRGVLTCRGSLVQVQYRPPY
jgi:hypothetical protein